MQKCAVWIREDQFDHAQRIQRPRGLPQTVRKAGPADRRPVNGGRINNITVAVQNLKSEARNRIGVAPEQWEFIIHSQSVGRFPPRIDDHIVQRGGQNGRGSR